MGKRVRRQDKLKDKQKAATTAKSEDKQQTRTEADVTETDAGLQYVDFKVGRGPFPEAGKLVCVRYKGMLKNGTMFDSGKMTFHSGRGQVIAGMDLGVASMRQGGMRKLLIPPELGYGTRGAPPKIPPHAELVFDVELQRVGTRREVAEAEEDAEWNATLSTAKKQTSNRKGSGRQPPAAKAADNSSEEEDDDAEGNFGDDGDAEDPEQHQSSSSLHKQMNAKWQKKLKGGGGEVQAKPAIKKRRRGGKGPGKNNPHNRAKVE